MLRRLLTNSPKLTALSETMSNNGVGNMEQVERVSYWDMDTIQKPDGYDMTSVPDCTRENIKMLVDEHNKLVDVVNVLLTRTGLINP